MFLFKKKSKSYLGIDIGAAAVKIVELEKTEGRHKLKNYGIYSLKGYLEKSDYQVSSESAMISNEEMAEIIKKTIKEAKINSREVYLSIPVYSSFSTLIDFPDMSEKEIASAVPFEARKYVPVPISEVILDWSIVSSAKEQAGFQVLLIAVPKKTINNYNQIVDLANLNLRGIEEETFSLGRALVGDDKSIIILIDAGARSINVSIIDNGYIRTTHNLEMGGAKMTKAIAQQMNFSSSKAEELKEKLSTESTEEQSPQLKGIIQSTLGVIAIEIKKIIDSYQGKYNRKIEKCIVVGGSVQLFGLIDHLTNTLGLDISIGDPFARVAYPHLLKSALKELGPSLAVAIGLAMRE